MLLRALDRTSRQPLRCAGSIALIRPSRRRGCSLKRLQAGAQLCQLFIDGRIFAQWTIELGPLIEATSYVRTWSGNPQNSMDVIGQAITLAITKPNSLHKSFIINSMHGEGIEPPTYWV